MQCRRHGFDTWVKKLRTIQETWAQSLDRKDPLEMEMAIYSSILAWENSMDRGAQGYSPWGHRGARHDLVTKQQQREK